MLTLRAATIAVLVLALVAAPLAVKAQQSSKPARLGILYEATPVFAPDSEVCDGALVAGLRDHGYIVNLRTAKALGLTLPPSVLARADRLIE